MQKRANEEQNQYEIRYEQVIEDRTKLLFGDAAPGRLPRQEKISFLLYHNFYEVGICTEGEGLFFADGEFWTVRKGDTIFIPPAKGHYSRSLYRDKPCYCRFLYLREEILHLGMEENHVEVCRVPSVIRSIEHPRAAAQLAELCRFGFEKTAESVSLAAHQLAIFLLDSARYFEKARRASARQIGTDQSVTERLCRHLSIHYRETESVRDLAEKIHLSESQIRRRFVSAYGVPPVAYRNRLRCEIACELLLSTELGIAEIAEQVGFFDPTVFYRRFKAEIGISPSNFRKKAKHLQDC